MSNSPLHQTKSAVEPRRHLLIAGTGRAGTSILVRILTACGFDTELTRNAGAWWDDTASAGLETIPLFPGEHPYVVKSPWSYQFIRQLLDDPNVRLDSVLVPVRRLEEAAASRIVLDIQQLYRSQPALLDLEDDWTARDSTPGGVTYSLQPLDVARVLAHSFHRLIEALVEREIPVHLLAFPRFCTDLDYLLRALAPVLPADLDLAALRERIAPVIEPDKIRMAEEMAKTKRESASETPQEGYPGLSNLHAVSLKREVKRMSVELAGVCTQLRAAAQERETLTSALRDAVGRAEGLEKLLEVTRAEKNNLRSALDVEKSENTNLHDALRAEQAQVNYLLNRSQLLQRLEANLQSLSVCRAMRRMWARLRETGDKLTGGGMRALAKRTLTKSLRHRERPSEPTRLGQ